MTKIPEVECPMALAEKIRSRRAELGLTQAQLGKRVGWPDSRIGGYERGETKPGRASLVKLAKALEIDIKELEEQL